MSARTCWILFLMFLCLPSLARAAERPLLSDGIHDGVTGGSLSAAAANRDTLYLIGPWGSGAPVNGQFETPDGAPAWNGFTHLDMTQATESKWHVDTYQVVSGEYSAWCGERAYPACSELDVEGGYGNYYDELLVWTSPVSDPGMATTLDVTALVNHDVEPGYDYVHLGYFKGEENIAYLWTADGAGEQVPVGGSVTYQPGEYTGDLGNEVRLAWHVTSDGGWSDADCSYESAGAMQVDEITVTMTHDGIVTTAFDDFEDGTLGNWAVDYPAGVGDYAHIRSGLGDIDPCATNPTPQVCFLADDIMLAERGLPTQTCLSWCYGPGGYIVNTQGGAAGPENHLHNEVHSPIITWPGGDYQGISILFDVYLHEDLSADAPGMFYTWGLRSSPNDDIYGGNYADREFVYYGEGYRRGGDDQVGDLLVPDCNIVRFEFRTYELGYIWGWTGDDGYPAPYLDNVQMRAYTYEGPHFYAREVDLAQDAFPGDGHLHTGADLGLNDVRFDMARNISPAAHLRIDPGDSIVVALQAVREGATLVTEDVGPTVTAPRLWFTIRTNPVFDAHRLPVGPFTTDSEDPLSVLDGEILSHAGGVMSGYVQGAASRRNGVEDPWQWMFDLPDADFLYPGDILHYYIEAWDETGGVYRGAALPVDRTGYGDFADPLGYDPGFVVHALPTMYDGTGETESILFWNDQGNRGGRDEWWRSLGEMGLAPGGGVDVYYTNAPTSGVGNGLGSRATPEQIDGYTLILYTAGDMSRFTLTNSDLEEDGSNDLGLLEAWLATGDRGLLVSGDNVVSDLLTGAGPAGQTFASDRMGVDFRSESALWMLGGDVAARVEAIPGNPLFNRAQTWLAYGGCPTLNTFDGVVADPGERLAVFGDGSSELSAATRHVGGEGSVVVSLPYDLRFVREAVADDKSPIPSRTMILTDFVESWFILIGDPVVGTPLPGATFSVGAYPNPFNPSTRIEYSLPRAGHLQLKVFDVRGQLVRTLVDERREAGPGHVTWDGTDASGRGLSSGLYFYEARSGQDVRVDKLMLLK